MSNQLLPCPFCGGDAQMAESDTVYWVKCTQCESEGATNAYSAKAIAAWNRRATQPAAGEPIGKIVSFGPKLHEVAWSKGKLPPLGTELYAAPPAAAHGDEAVRKDAEIAIKQGRYLASAAEDYINAIHDAFDLEETNLHREVVGDSNRRLSSAIYEFRRSAYRAMRTQGDGD